MSEKMQIIKFKSRAGEEIFNLLTDVEEEDMEDFFSDLTQKQVTECVINIIHFYNDVFINRHVFLEIDTDKMAEGQYLDRANRVKELNDLASSDKSNEVIYILLRKKHPEKFMNVYRVCKDIVDKEWCEAGLFLKKD